MRIAIFVTMILFGAVTMARAYSAPDIIAEVKIRAITSACATFEIEYGIFPPQTNWFAELTAATNAVLNRRKIALLDARDSKDPWGRDFVYRHPGRHNTNRIDVYSLGRDGRSSSGGNDADDINNWNSNEPWRQTYSGSDIKFQQVALVLGGIGLLWMLLKFIRRQIETRHGEGI